MNRVLSQLFYNNQVVLSALKGNAVDYLLYVYIFGFGLGKPTYETYDVLFIISSTSV